MARKPTINTDLFARTDPEAVKAASHRSPVTVYLYDGTIARLHDAWMAALAKDAKATKSAIIERALLAYLDKA
jgi:hypothetical protein